jgi:hypothetical protein
MRGLGLNYVGRTNRFVGNQQVHNSYACGLRFLPRRGDLVWGDKAQVHEDVY